MKPGHKQYQRFAAMLPVQDDKNPIVQMYPITTLADDKEQATWLARDAGLVLIGQIDAFGNIIITGP